MRAESSENAGALSTQYATHIRAWKLRYFFISSVPCKRRRLMTGNTGTDIVFLREYLCSRVYVNAFAYSYDDDDDGLDHRFRSKRSQTEEREHFFCSIFLCNECVR